MYTAKSRQTQIHTYRMSIEENKSSLPYQCASTTFIIAIFHFKIVCDFQVSNRVVRDICQMRELYKRFFVYTYRITFN